jgi:hypothetical protein
MLRLLGGVWLLVGKDEPGRCAKCETRGCSRMECLVRGSHQDSYIPLAHPLGESIFCLLFEVAQRRRDGKLHEESAISHRSNSGQTSPRDTRSGSVGIKDRLDMRVTCMPLGIVPFCFGKALHLTEGYEVPTISEQL